MALYHDRISQELCNSLHSPRDYEEWRGPHNKIEIILFNYGKNFAILKEVTELPDDLTAIWCKEISSFFVYRKKHLHLVRMFIRARNMMHDQKISKRTYWARTGIALGYSKTQIRNFINRG